MSYLPDWSNTNESPYTWPDDWPELPRRRRRWPLLLLLLMAAAVVAWRIGLLG